MNFLSWIQYLGRNELLILLKKDLFKTFLHRELFKVIQFPATQSIHQ